MNNSILERFQTYIFIDGVCEIDYDFEASPPLQNILKNFDENSILYLEDNKKASPKLKILKLPKPCKGFRIRAGQHIIYLNLDANLAPNDKSLHNSFKKHYRYMSIYNLYYPKNTDILEYWDKPDDLLNKSELYLNDLERSYYLGDLIKKYCSKIKSSLEIGCNLGRNLNYLKTNLNLKVSGCEISLYALQQLRKNHPALNDSPMFLGPVQDKIQLVPDNSFDLVFSMAVLMHLHPSTHENFWKDIKRVARKNIVTIENEGSATNRAWPRNYKGIFESIGCKEIYSNCFVDNPPEAGLRNYTVRVFAVA